MESINYLGWELNLSIRPPRFLKYCLEVPMNTNQWERLSWKTVSSRILSNNNTKWVSSQLFGCDRIKLGSLGRGHLHHLIYITELLIVWTVGYMDSNIIDWGTKPIQLFWNGNLPTWMWCLNLHNQSQYSLLGQRGGERFLKNLQKGEGHFETT